MLYVVGPENRDLYWKELASMHHLRTKVFKQALGWDVNIVNGLEIDQFDIPEAYYLIYLDESGEVLGSTRLMSTDGPYLLGDVFSNLVQEIKVPRDTAIWESTRFCADPQKAPKNIAGVLMAGMLEFALYNGIRNYVSVSDIRMETVIKRAGWGTRRLGEPVSTGNEISAAEWFDISHADYESVKNKMGLSGPVILNLNELETRKVA